MLSCFCPCLFISINCSNMGLGLPAIIGLNFLLVKQILWGRNYLQSLIKLNKSISVRNFACRLPPPKKKSLLQTGSTYFSPEFLNFDPEIQVNAKTKRYLLHSGSISVWNFEFLIAKWVLLAKNWREADIFLPLSIRPKGAPPLPPQNQRQCLQ